MYIQKNPTLSKRYQDKERFNFILIKKVLHLENLYSLPLVNLKCSENFM